jgi:hypothetical protein
MSYTLNYNFTPNMVENLKKNCNVRDFSKENEEKYLVSYNKNKTLVETVGLHRSLIFLNGNLVCFSPPKSLSFNNFCNKYPMSENIVIEEFIEGTMINVFYNNVSQVWEIATKNNIGATNHFYKNSIYSFGNIFYDTCRYIGFNLEEALNKKYCYSFVMKHPYNQLIEIVTKPSLYLIDVYEIENEQNPGQSSSISIHVKNKNEIADQLSINWDIKIPTKFLFSEYKDIIFLKLFPSNDNHYIRKCISMGYVIKNVFTGERTKLRNDEYEYLHKLKGNQPDLLYHYLSLRQSGCMIEYLKYFPENYNLFNGYRNELHCFTENVYSCYKLIHIEKERGYDIPKCYKQHVYKIHGIYISHKINNTPFKVTKPCVINYINELHPSILIKSLNEYLNICYSPTFIEASNK